MKQGDAPVEAPDRLEVVFEDGRVASLLDGKPVDGPGRPGPDGPDGAAPELPASPAEAAQGRAWSADIQALRALAVMLVVVFHFWPQALPGGYIGVDVFFVISGFLITGHLLRDIEAGQVGAGRFLARFYARRARRLLPISLLVLAVTMFTVFWTQPSLIWKATAQQVLASALYVQNWVLAGQHVDYLNPEFPPTAVQHFWSLSVEEQFYLVWPAALLLVSVIAMRLSKGRRDVRALAVTGLMALALVVSLGYAIRATGQVTEETEGIYFFSTARVWQFAAGGLLASVVASGWLGRSGRRERDGQPGEPGSGWLASVPAWACRVASLAGFAAIMVAGFTLDEDSPVPGTAALLPVLGAVAVLAAGHGANTPAPVWIRARPVQWLGNVSYSLYLWHWPVLLLVPALIGIVPGSTEPVGDVRKAGLLLLCFGLAAISKPLVEDRFRRPGLPAVLVIAGGMAVTLALSGFTWRTIDHRGPEAEVLATKALAAHTPCFGAVAMLDSTCTDPPFGEQVTPDPTFALDSFAETDDWHGCFVMSGSKKIAHCEFGPKDASVHIALFGDSHAMAALPMVQQAAAPAGWRISTFMRASCPPNVAVPVRPTKKETGRCGAWVDDAIDQIDADPSVTTVLTTAYNIRQWVTPDGGDSYDVGVRGYQETWRRLSGDGKRQVIVLKDVPRSAATMMPCVARSHSGGEGCSLSEPVVTTARGAWHDRPDPIVAAAQTATPPVPVLDLTDAFCRDGDCPAVIGNVLVYADLSHITPTFARTLGPEFGRRLTALMQPGAGDPNSAN